MKKPGVTLGTWILIAILTILKALKTMPKALERCQKLARRCQNLEPVSKVPGDFPL